MLTAELLATLVSINSAFPGALPEPTRPGENMLAEFIETFLRGRGFEVQRQAVGNRFNVLAERGQGERALLLSGHMDTVPAVQGWSADPWTPRIDGDKLYGLGACDMKAGLCAVLRATENYIPRNYKLKLAFLVDEENISEGAATLVQSSWIQDVIAVLVPELGTSGPQHLGARMMTLGRRGRVDLRIQVHGRSAHAAYETGGVSAVLRGAAVALALSELPLANHPELGPAGATIRSFVSQAAGLSIPDLAELTIDRHLVPPETEESARHDVEALIEQLYQTGVIEQAPDMPIAVTIPERRTPYLMPYVTARDTPFALLVESAVRDLLGQVAPNYGRSVADENYFGATLRLPVVVLGPFGGNNHAPDEWVSLASLEELIAVYREVLVRFDTFVEQGA